MEVVINRLIRPTRSVYSLSELGPADFRVQGVIARRDDFTLRNARGLSICCSWFVPIHNHPLPCLVYCHGNCGNRLDAMSIVETMLPLGISVMTMDFAGSGLSEGEYVSLGFYEKEDVRTVVNFLRGQRRVKSVSLWGRSMGAAAALLYGSEDHSITYLILDSPFTSLSDLIKEQIGRLKWVPFSLSLSVIRKVKKQIIQIANFDLDQVNPILAVTKCWSPCTFIHAVDDELISVNHSIRLVAAYMNKHKELYKTKGGHNGQRPVCLVQLMARRIHDFSGTSPFDRDSLPVKKESLCTLIRKRNHCLYPSDTKGTESLTISPRSPLLSSRSTDRDKTVL